MTTETWDYGEHKPKPANDAVREITELVDLAGIYEAQIKTLKTQLEDLEKAHSDLTEDQIPNRMKMCGLSELITQSGYKVQIDTDLFVSIPSIGAITKERDPVKRQRMVERRVQCFQWLKDNGHDSHIKREVTIELGKGSDEQAQGLMERLRKEEGLHVNESVEVHPQTLRSLFKRFRKESKAFPAEMFAVFDKAVAKVSRTD